MNYTTLTYNLHYNKASQELRSVLKDCDPDIVFLQELTTDEESMKTIMELGYELADFSNSFVKGKISTAWPHSIEHHYSHFREQKASIYQVASFR